MWESRRNPIGKALVPNNRCIRDLLSWGLSCSKIGTYDNVGFKYRRMSLFSRKYSTYQERSQQNITYFCFACYPLTDNKGNTCQYWFTGEFLLIEPVKYSEISKHVLIYLHEIYWHEIWRSTVCYCKMTKKLARENYNCAKFELRTLI